MTMTSHPTDEDLILRFYGESRPADAARLDAHIETCALCRNAWTDLSETLRLVDGVQVPEPDAGFERVMWARVQQGLPPVEAPVWSFRRLAPLVGLAAIVIVLLNVTLSHRLATPDVPVAAADPAGDIRERVLLTALDTHFEQTEMLLVELMNAPESDQHALEFERETADDLVASGRLYRATAAERGDETFVRMLEDLESVLVDVARGPATVDRSEMASLRARIDGEDLLFKVRAVTNEVRGRQQALWTVSEGPL
jgi:hypothetical protein